NNTLVVAAAASLVVFIFLNGDGWEIFHVMYPLSNTSCRSRMSRQRQIASRNSSCVTLLHQIPYTLISSRAMEKPGRRASQPASQPKERIAFQLTTRKIRPLLLITALSQRV
ncbi:hypothetical protein Chor_012509, partial [Crotalus horridus]